MDRSRHRLGVAALAASLLLLTSCGNSPDSDASKLGQSRDVGPAGTPDSAAPADPRSEDGALAATNLYDRIIEAQRAAGSYRTRMVGTTSAGDLSLEAEVTYASGDYVGRVVSLGETHFELVIAEGTLYMQMDTLPIPDGKWLAVDMSAPENVRTIGAIAIYADQELALRAGGALDSLERTGKERTNGVATTRYRADASTANWAEVLDLDAAGAALLPPSVPVEFWIGRGDRLIQLSSAYSLGDVETTSQQTFYDYGADIDIAIPDAGDTVTTDDIGLS